MPTKKRVRSIHRSFCIPLPLLEYYEKEAQKMETSTNRIVVEALKKGINFKESLNKAYEKGRRDVLQNG